MDKTIKIAIVQHSDDKKPANHFIEVVSNGLKNSVNKITHQQVQLFQILFADLEKVLKSEHFDFLVLFPERNASQILSFTFLEQIKGKSSVIFQNEDEFSLTAKNFEGLNYVDFFDVEYLSNRLRTYNYEIRGNESRLFWLKILDLSSDIAYKVNGMTSKQRIWISEGSGEILEFYDALVRNLKSFDFAVVPDKCIDMASKSKTNTENSGVKLNICIANSKNNKWQSDLRQVLSNTQAQTVLWLPYGLKLEDRASRELLDSLASNPKAEVVQMPFDDFLKLIHNKLDIGESKNQDFNRFEFSHSVYLIHDPKDNQRVKNISSELKSKNINPLFINFDESRYNFVEEHRLYLSKADDVVIIDNQSPERWLESKLRDLIKAPGYGRQKPLKTKRILTQDPNKLKSLKNLDSSYIISPLEEGLKNIQFTEN